MYCTLAGILRKEEDLRFASTMVQQLNIILFTSAELFEMRMQLKDLSTEVQLHVNACMHACPVHVAGVSRHVLRVWHLQEDWRLFGLLYHCWCHNAAATIALCLLTQNYQHVSDLIDSLYPSPMQCVRVCVCAHACTSLSTWLLPP